MSGITIDGRDIRKGAAEAIARHVAEGGQAFPAPLQAAIDRIARGGGTPLVVAEQCRPLGVVHLKDVVKGGMRQRFRRCARWASAP